MKTIKIIDLLNKIANGEEVPEKIKYKDVIRIYDVDDKDYVENSDIHHYLFYNVLTSDSGDKFVTALNDEVEILEEKKIPRKLSTWFSLEKDCENDNIQYANHNFETMYEKINEICDYLKSKEKGE